VADTPDDLVFEVHAETLWPEHSYGYSILGTPETLGRLGADDLRCLHQTGYHPGNCVVAAAGHLEHGQLLTVLEREGWFEGAARVPAWPAVAAGAATRGCRRVEARDTAQTHVVFGTDTFPLRDARRFPLAILTNVFGGGMSSRLFQRVREELGLAYAVFAYKHFYQSSGQLGVYVGAQTSTADQAVEAIRDEYDRLAREGLPAAELAHGKQQLKGQIMLSLESPMARMGRLAGFTLHDDHYRPLDEMLAEIDAVTQDRVAEVAAEFFPAERQTVVRLGPPVLSP
jgi:predicted Zn-dependent peptidase